jgi:hypothetical protein
MRRLSLFVLFMMPALVLLTTTPGCGKKEEAKKGTGEVKKSSEAKKDGEEKKGTAAGEKTPLEAKLDGTITGKVTFEGEPPVPEPQKMEAKDDCMTGAKEFEKIKQTWMVDPKTKAVENVVIYLEPPAGKYFNLAPEDKKRKDVIMVDQPHCAFVPHVVAVFPAYFDGKELVKTGEVLRIQNDAAFPHNTKWDADGVFNDPWNSGSMPPKTHKDPAINPQPKPLKIVCNFHTWMNGWVWAFDNPYHAVTRKPGTFEIKRVPTGVEVTVVGWHEGVGEFYREKKTFKAGDNPPLELKVKK